MYTNFPLYPTEIFTVTDYPVQTNSVDTVYADLINALRSEIQACFDEIGVLPKRIYTDVSERLDLMEIAAGMGVPAPISQWKMNDNAANTTVIDSVGSNTGTASANTSTMSVTGKINTALEFIGSSSEKVNCGSGTSLNIIGSISIVFWIKSTDENSSSIIDRDTPSSPYPGYAIMFSRTTAGKFDFGINGGWQANLNTTTVHDGEWHHVAITGSGTTGKIYIDGVLDGTFTYSALVTTPSNTFYIGSNEGSSSFFTGALDDIRIYDFALSLSEVLGINNLENGTEEERPLKR